MIIFSPGPSNISERVRSALAHPDICHRDDEFEQLLLETRQLLLRAGNLDGTAYRAVLLTGSGSSAIESVAAAAREVGPVLVVSNGVYGERAAAMCRYHGTEAVELRRPWGAPIDPEDVRETAAEAGVGCVYFVHHETTTGRLNDLPSLVSAARVDSDRLVLVDAVSSIAGENLEIAEWGLDAVIGSANKCIRGVPGAAFVLASERFVDAATHQSGAHYSNFARHLELEDSGSTPFTPALQAYFGLHAALEELLEEGVANRVHHFHVLATTLMEGMSRLGFQTLLEPIAYGHTLLSYALPKGMTFRQLHGPLKERGFVIYGAQGTLSESSFRLGLVGHFGLDAIDGFLSAVEEVV